MPQREFIKIIIILCLICGIGPFSTDLYLPAVPLIANDMSVSVPSLQLTVSIFFAGMGVGQLIYGPLADAYGRKITLEIGIIVFILSSIGEIFVTKFEYFLLLRLIQALGASAGTVLINAILRDLFDGYQFVKAVTITMLTINVAPLVAPSLGGIIVPYGWRLVFVFLLVFGLGTFLSVSFGLKETLNFENRQSIKPKAILKNYFVVCTSAKSLGALIAQTLNGAGLFAFIAGSPFVYITYFGVSPQLYGVLFGMNVLCIFCFTAFNTILVKKFGLLKTLLGALIFSAIGGVTLLISACMHFSNVFSIVIPIVMFVSVVGIVGSNTTTYILGLFPEKSGTASAAMGALRFGGGALAGFLLNLYPAEDAIPLAITICICGILALGSFWGSRLYLIHSEKQKANS